MTKYILILYQIILFPILKQGGGYEHNSWGRPSCLIFQGLNYVLCLLENIFYVKAFILKHFIFGIIQQVKNIFYKSSHLCIKLRIMIKQKSFATYRMNMMHKSNFHSNIFHCGETNKETFYLYIRIFMQISSNSSYELTYIYCISVGFFMSQNL